jgi:hypothetical protein
MTLAWAVQTAVGAAIAWTVYGALTLLWARRRLLPFLRQHAPTIARAIDEITNQ